jgi:hypothetical protein
MKKKIVVSVLIAVTITAVLICIILGIMIKSSEPPPVTLPPKSEYIKINVSESALVAGNSIKLISLEEEKGIVKIEVRNETTGDQISVPLSLREDGEAFKYRNIAIIPGKVEDNRITLLIFIDAGPFHEGISHSGVT